MVSGDTSGGWVKFGSQYVLKGYANTNYLYIKQPTSCLNYLQQWLCNSCFRMSFATS